MLKICFQKRRKQLGTILGPQMSALARNHLESQDLSLCSRPEELGPSVFQALTEALFVRKGVDNDQQSD